MIFKVQALFCSATKKGPSNSKCAKMTENWNSKQEKFNRIYHYRRRHRHCPWVLLLITSLAFLLVIYVKSVDSLPATAASLQNKLNLKNKIKNLTSIITNNLYYHHKEIFGSEANYILEWTVDHDKKTVLFNVSALCKGYVALGLSKNGSITTGTDFVVGGINSNSGKPYVTDMHGTSRGTLRRDYKQDWTFVGGHKGKDGRAHMTFSRPFDTCDDDDYQINDDLVYIIWAFGDTDEVTLSAPKQQGSHPVYLLDRDTSPNIALSVYQQVGPHSNQALMQRWRAMSKQKIPSRTTSQICSIIRGPRLTLRHFIVGGGAYLPYKDSRKHVRKIILSRCIPPNDDPVSLFDPFLKSMKDGEECDSHGSSHSFPKQLCSKTIFMWGYGGKAFYFPENVGIPIGNTRSEYFMLEVHYHNPGHLDDLAIKSGLDLMFHPKPRQEADVLTVSYATQGLFTIPPFSNSFNIYGHCSSDCIKNGVVSDKNGFNVFAAMIQMGHLGRSAKLRHFRGNNELEWILKDDNFITDYQQIRQIRKEANILPGDQITLQCTYDTSTVGNTTFSGISDKEERCVAYLFVDKAVTAAWCSSEYSLDTQLHRFGVDNISWDNKSQTRVVRSATTNSMVNLPLWKVTDNFFHWSPTVRTTLQRDFQFGLQKVSCPSQEQLRQSLPTKLNNPMNNGGGGIRSRMPIESTPLPSENSSPGKATVTLPKVSPEYKHTSPCQLGRSSAQRSNILRGNYNYKPLVNFPSLNTVSSTRVTPTKPSTILTTSSKPGDSLKSRLFKPRGRVRLGFGRFNRLSSLKNSSDTDTGVLIKL